MKRYRCRQEDFETFTNLLHVEGIRDVESRPKGSSITLRERLLRIRNLDKKTKHMVRHMYTNVDLELRFGTTVLQSPFGLGSVPTTVSKHLLSYLRFADPKNDWSEAFYPLAREQADLSPWDPKLKNVRCSQSSERVTSYDDIIAGPKGVSSNRIT